MTFETGWLWRLQLHIFCQSCWNRRLKNIYLLYAWYYFKFEVVSPRRRLMKYQVTFQNLHCIEFWILSSCANFAVTSLNYLLQPSRGLWCEVARACMEASDSLPVSISTLTYNGWKKEWWGIQGQGIYLDSEYSSQCWH